MTHIVGLTTNEANSLKTFLANHMNKPEDQVRWRWSAGDLAMWDNRVTMHYALADYLPEYRCMNRVTVVRDRRIENSIEKNRESQGATIQAHAVGPHKSLRACLGR